MTVCIAAITENKDIVAIADKKLTQSLGATTVYEITENKKIIQLNDTSFAMLAGGIVNANAILKIAISDIAVTDDVATCAAKVQKAYFEKLADAIDIEILRKHGLDLETFKTQQTILEPTFVRSVIENINQANLGVEIIIAGKNGESPELYVVNVNGVLDDFTPIGYAYVGSGSSHANLSLIESEVHPGKTKAGLLYAIIKAKKKAEYDPNVGHMSSLVTYDDDIKFIDDDVIENLWSEYDDSANVISESVNTSSDRMKELVYGTA